VGLYSDLTAGAKNFQKAVLYGRAADADTQLKFERTGKAGSLSDYKLKRSSS